MSRDPEKVLDPDLNEEMLRMVKQAAKIAAELTERKLAPQEPGENSEGEAGGAGEGEEE